MDTTSLFSLAGKRALVTGGSSGIGLAIVNRFLAAGANVVAADLVASEALGRTTASFVSLDVTLEDRVARVFEEVEASFGKLDVLVNNAGIALQEGPIHQIEVDLFNRTLEVNLLGVLHGLKYGPKHMNNGGSMWNIFIGILSN